MKNFSFRDFFKMIYKKLYLIEFEFSNILLKSFDRFIDRYLFVFSIEKEREICCKEIFNI